MLITFDEQSDAVASAAAVALLPRSTRAGSLRRRTHCVANRGADSLKAHSVWRLFRALFKTKSQTEEACLAARNMVYDLTRLTVQRALACCKKVPGIDDEGLAINRVRVDAAAITERLAEPPPNGCGLRYISTI